MIFRTGFVRLLLGSLVQDRIDFAQRKAGDLDVVELQLLQPLVFDRENVAVPARQFGDPVVGNDERLLVGLRQRAQCDDRHQLQAQ